MAKGSVPVRHLKKKTGKAHSQPKDAHKSDTAKDRTERKKSKVRVGSTGSDKPKAKPRRPVAAWVKEAADRAEAMLEGRLLPEKPKVPITPYGPDYEKPRLPRKRLTKSELPVKCVDDDDEKDEDTDTEIVDEDPESVEAGLKAGIPAKIAPIDEAETIISGLTHRRTRSTTKSGNHHFKILLESYRPDYPEKAAKLVLNGAVERDLIAYFQVTKKVFDIWQAMYPEFAAALAISKEASLADQRVERSVYQMALGYNVEAEKIMNYRGQVIRAKYQEHIPANINAAKFWLINRDPQKWGRDPEKVNSELSAKPSVLNVNMIKGMSTDQLRQLLQVLKAMLTPTPTLSRIDGVTINQQSDDVEELEYTLSKTEAEDTNVEE